MKAQRLIPLLLITTVVGFAVMTAKRAINTATAASSADARSEALDATLYTRTEFFGVQAIAPYPTAEARTRLIELETKYPSDPEITLKLAEFDEKLGDVAQATGRFQRLVGIEKNSLGSLRRLAAFYERQGRFAEQALTYESMLRAAPMEERATLLQELIGMARRHGLEKYRQPAFFRKLIADEPGAFDVVKQFIEHLKETGEQAEALAAVRQYKAAFPEQHEYFLEQEIAALTALNRNREAEQVYTAAFDPFWENDRADRFYEFLSGNDRLRAYGRELKETVKRKPSNLDACVKLFDYLQHESGAGEASTARVLTTLEAARAAGNVKWTRSELTTVARLLIADRQFDPASRFLYTLYNEGGLAPGSEERERVLYSLFKLLIEAGGERTPFTAGDLSFYQDVAKSDPHPGMLGGVLSLLLANSDPSSELENADRIAVAEFNRLAAWRIFSVYKTEYPLSPVMGAMYLDLIRLYTSMEEAETADQLLIEFEKRNEESPRYTEIAFRLADGFVAVDNKEKERAVYRRLLDRVGRSRRPDQRLVPLHGMAGADLTSQAATVAEIQTPDDDVSLRSQRRRPEGRTNRREQGNATYVTALDRCVSSLARENRMAEILSLYADEVKKYPDEEGLYERWLQWLGQTNLVDEQLRVYKEAIKRFPADRWSDRLARWYLRQGRNQEFDRYSRELIERMNDEEIGKYLDVFPPSSAGFDRNLFLGLLEAAHRRFPHHQKFVDSLLSEYARINRWDDWRRLAAEQYFESRRVREQYLGHVASANKLREYAASARNRDSLIYKLFRADAAVWLSNYEEAVDVYRELNRLYPNTPEYAERLAAFTRSFGQKNMGSLEEASRVQQSLADGLPSSADYRTTAGEIYAELGQYKNAAREWDRLIALGVADKQVYLDAATVYWDYYQYDDAMRVILAMRRRLRDDSLSAFELAAIYESKRQLAPAITEYVKGLDESAENHFRASRRLATLWERKGSPPLIRAAIGRRMLRPAGRETFVQGAVEFYQKVERDQDAAALLRREMARSKSQNLLTFAREFFREREDDAGEVAALRRLAAVAQSPRLQISYQLQLAERAANKNRKEEAAALLGALVARYPTNYGVLTEAADFYWRLGKRDSATTLLAQASGRSKGKYRYIFARKLVSRQVELGRLDAAEQGLAKLYKENPQNLDVFRELSRIYVSTSRPELLRERYRETIRAIKASGADRGEVDAEIEQLRLQVIESFTSLKDYPAAIEQYIEIINRTPEEPSFVENAVNFTKRYGGADQLIAYYTKTSQQADRNYRWNLVLARILDAGGDQAGAARELQKAIKQNPEKLALRSELANLYLKSKTYDAAIEVLTTAVKLSNDDPGYIQQLAAAFDRAGRKADADAARARLPVQKSKARTLAELFTEALTTRASEPAKAAELFRRAFDQYAADIYKYDLRDYELSGYVQAMRSEEPLDQIMRRLWDLRMKAATESAGKENLLAAKARALMDTIDRVLPEAVGRMAAEYATGNELAAIDRDLRERLKDPAAGAEQRLVVLYNLSQRAGLEELSEQILLSRMNASFPILENPSGYQGHLMTLVNFYSERGAYGRIAERLAREQERDPNREKFGYRPLIAEYARLAGDAKGELAALRSYYQSKTGGMIAGEDSLIARYFEALVESGAAGRSELRQCIEQPHPYRFQFISFLVSKQEVAMAREAIEKTPLPAVWKSARQAELSVYGHELDRSNERAFLDALAWKTTGDSTAARPDSTRQLIGDDWFQLAGGYGQWLLFSERAKLKSATASAAFLPAIIENRPKDQAAQARLANWYLEQGAYEKAVDHFQVALELGPELKSIVANLGMALYKQGARAQAEEQWAKLIAGKNPKPEDCLLYLQTLGANGLSSKARETIKPLLIERLKSADSFDSLRLLVHALSKSYSDAQAGEVAAFLHGLCEAAPKNIELPQAVIREGLIDRSGRAPFYEMLIARSSEDAAAQAQDFEYLQLRREHPDWSIEDVEETLDHRRREMPKRPESARLAWRRETLAHLIAERKDAAATDLLVKIEQGIEALAPRPEWMRLAKTQLDLRAGRLELAMARLKRFALIEPGPGVLLVQAPNLTRLNDAVALLRREKREAESKQLLAYAYERTLALEQLSPPPFIGLARLSFEAGNVERGLKLLGLMISLGQYENRDAAAGQVAALEGVKARAVANARIEAPRAANLINEALALKLAAECAAEFGQFDFARTARERYATIIPLDADNRIELARINNAAGRGSDAVAALVAVMADVRTTRLFRWTALWTMGQVAAKNESLWQSASTQLKTASKDVEMTAATEALAELQRGGSLDAVPALVQIPGGQSRYLAALAATTAGQPDRALSTLTDSMIRINDVTVGAPFRATQDDFRWTLARLYGATGRSLAMLRVANGDERLRGRPQGALAELDPPVGLDDQAPNPSRLSSLNVQAAERERRSRLELLALLSDAAEKTGQLRQAIEFQRARFDLSPDASTRAESKTRIAALLSKEKDLFNKKRAVFVVK
jgi:tetratricopeptide (TPR) repeat protein/lipopolysaccharide biosynthesis regulator YciM